MEGIEWYRNIGEPYVEGWVYPDYDEFAQTIATKAGKAVKLSDYLFKAESGDVGAMFLLGTECLEGYEVPHDEDMAIKWLRKAAESGHAAALDSLWSLLDEDIPGDIDEAVAWFSMLAEKGDAAMKWRLAEWLHENEWPEAIKWYHKAAEQGQPDAQRTLGDLYLEGDGVDRNLNEACSWYFRAAEQGDADAQYGWWSIYRDESFPGGRETAVMFCRKAAEQGHPDAQADLGELYASGHLVERDWNEAVWWFLKAAEQGHPDAQLRVGVLLYQRLRETHVDAYKWLAIAASHDEESSREARYRMIDVRENMTEEMVAEAEKLAKEWKPKRLRERWVGLK